MNLESAFSTHPQRHHMSIMRQQNIRVVICSALQFSNEHAVAITVLVR